MKTVQNGKFSLVEHDGNGYSNKSKWTSVGVHKRLLCAIKTSFVEYQPPPGVDELVGRRQ